MINAGGRLRQPTLRHIAAAGAAGMSDESRLRVLAGEHLPDGVASQPEFLAFFRHLLQASRDGLEVQKSEVRVICWCVPGGVHHHVIVRDVGTGRACCRLGIEVDMHVPPAELDGHATDLARLLSEALNLEGCVPPPNDPGHGQ
jgi:hypothetical protein